MGFSLQTPLTGQPDSTEQPKEASDFTILQNWGNGNIDPADVKAAFAQSAGMNQAGQTVKGSTIISTSQSTGSTTYTTLTTPDQVTGIVLASAGLITVLFQATWQESVINTAAASIFLGSNAVKIANLGQTAPLLQNAGIGKAATPQALSSFGGGLVSLNGTSAGSASYTGDVTTGQVLGVQNISSPVVTSGGPCYIFAAAGTYTVSIQYLVTSGTVTVSNRRLYVMALSFA